MIWAVSAEIYFVEPVHSQLWIRVLFEDHLQHWSKVADLSSRAAKFCTTLRTPEDSKKISSETPRIRYSKSALHLRF